MGYHVSLLYGFGLGFDGAHDLFLYGFGLGFDGAHDLLYGFGLGFDGAHDLEDDANGLDNFALRFESLPINLFVYFLHLVSLLKNGRRLLDDVLGD